MTNTFFEFHIIIGGILLVTALITHYFPPKKINGIYGYRTPRSMKDREHWDLAQKISTNEMLRAGLAMMALANLGWFIDLSKAVSLAIGFAVLIILLIRLFTKTENALKKLSEK